MLLLNRVIYKDNTVLTDYSRELSDVNASSMAVTIVAAEDAFYIGSDMPFNHRFFDVSTVNSVAGSVAVSIWNGSSFVAAVDVIDLTATAGVPFAKDGLIMWTTDRNVSWARASSTEEISDLSTLKIYNSYWVKMTFSAAFAFTTNYVGHKFAKDSDLNSYYGDLNRATVREAYFETATADWTVLHIAAAEEIIRDLRASKVVISANQILDPDTFRDASIHKLAEIAYSSFGPSHADRVEFAVNKYKEAMNKLVFNVDKDGDGKISIYEKMRDFRITRR
jgi:hypothetical protein